jgi:hypothetical protein
LCLFVVDQVSEEDDEAVIPLVTAADWVSERPKNGSDIFVKLVGMFYA